MLIALLQRYSGILSPYLATAYVMIAAAVATLIVGFIARGRAFFRYTPGVLYVLLSAVLFSPSMPHRYLPVVFPLIGAALLCHFILQRRDREGTVGMEYGSPGASLVYLSANLAVLAAFLFYRLGDFSGCMIGWDAWVSREFGVEYLKGVSIGSHTFDCLLWGSNAMTGSHLSLLYGALSYALLHVVGFSVWTLRFPSVIYGLLSVVMFYVIGRRFFCPLVGALAAALLAWNSNLLSYARYGCSPTATLFGVLLAIFFTWLFLDSDRPSWWMGPVCGLSLCLATLQYAPGRIGVLILLGLILVMVIRPWWMGLACSLAICLAANRYAPARTAVFILLGCIVAASAWQWRRVCWRRLLGVALILVIVFGFYRFQEKHQRSACFLHGGGEQYFSRRTGNKTAYDDLRTVRALVRSTAPEYIWLLSPHTDIIPEMVLSEPSRNPLYYAPLLPFIVWGCIYSLLRIRCSRHHGLLVAWFVLYTPPLLLCNVLNPNRTQLLIIPLLFWAAFGVQEAARLMRQAGVPRIVQHIFAVALMLMMMYAGVITFSFGAIPQSADYKAVSEEVATIPGPVIVGARLQMHSSYASLLNLELLERTRLDPEGRHSTLLEQVDWHIEAAVLEGKLGKGAVPDDYLNSLEKILETASLVLAPADKFMALGKALRARGHEMVPRRRGKCSLLLFPGGKFSRGVSKGGEASEDSGEFEDAAKTAPAQPDSDSSAD